MKNYKCRKCEYHFCSENGMPYCPACECKDLEKLEEDFILIKEDIILEEHHIHPKFMDNRNGKGEKFMITKKRHNIIHGKIMKWIWECIKKEDKKKSIDYVIKESKKYLGVDNGKKD